MPRSGDARAPYPRGLWEQAVDKLARRPTLDLLSRVRPVGEDGKAGGDHNVSEGRGGGIASNGTASSVILESSTLSGNHADGGQPFGGGISNGEGSLTINNSHVEDNTAVLDGGGVVNGGSLVLDKSTVTGNEAIMGDGGGIASGSLALNDTNVAHNAAVRGGGLYNFGALTLAGSSSVINNVATEEGGGILNLQSQGATISFTPNWTGTISGNEPDDVLNG